MLKSCFDWRPTEVSEVARRFLGSDPGVRTVRVILPFRRELVALPGRLSALLNEWREFIELETGLKFECKVAWSSAGPALKALLSYGRRMGKAGGPSFFFKKLG